MDFPQCLQTCWKHNFQAAFNRFFRQTTRMFSGINCLQIRQCVFHWRLLLKLNIFACFYLEFWNSLPGRLATMNFVWIMCTSHTTQWGHLLICILIDHKQQPITACTVSVFRGYYTMVRRYQFYVWVANTISHGISQYLMSELHSLVRYCFARRT